MTYYIINDEGAYFRFDAIEGTVFTSHLSKAREFSSQEQAIQYYEQMDHSVHTLFIVKYDPLRDYS